jgi:hypothetical protein
MVKRKNQKLKITPNNEFLKVLNRLNPKESKAYMVGTISGIIVGALFCLSGFFITIMGLTGSIEWILEAQNLKSKLTNASPGVFFAFLGMIIIWRYKPNVTDDIEITPSRFSRRLTFKSESESNRNRKMKNEKIVLQLGSSFPTQRAPANRLVRLLTA